MTDAAHALQEAELTPEEIERILRVCGTRALLVGGQALAAWAVHYGIEPVGDISRAVTTDADFIGTSDVARILQRSLGQPWKLRTGTLDDAGGQVAKVYATLPKEGIKQVDFLSGIVGLDTEAVRNRASTVVTADGVEVRILHPLDVLESRLRNLDALPGKRWRPGFAGSRSPTASTCSLRFRWSGSAIRGFTSSSGRGSRSDSRASGRSSRRGRQGAKINRCQAPI